MSEIEQGGRAFPWCGDLNDMPSINLGMTLRDWFAGKAMQGLIANSEGAGHGAECTVFWLSLDKPENHLYYAKQAYAIADAMLRARQS